MNKLIPNEGEGLYYTHLAPAAVGGKMDVGGAKCGRGLTNNIKRMRAALNTLGACLLCSFEQKLISSVLWFFCMNFIFVCRGSTPELRFHQVGLIKHVRPLTLVRLLSFFFLIPQLFFSYCGATDSENPLQNDGLQCKCLRFIRLSPLRVQFLPTNLLLCDGGKQSASRFTFILSLRDLMRHWHTCRPGPAGLLLMSRPPCESTLSLSLAIILEHYWLLMCLSTHPPDI